MPYRHEKFITAIIIIATLCLQSINIAHASFFEETGKNVDEMIGSFYSTLDQSVNAVTSIANHAQQQAVSAARGTYNEIRRNAIEIQRSFVNAQDDITDYLSSVKEGALALLPSHNFLNLSSITPSNPPYLKGEGQQQIPPLKVSPAERGEEGLNARGAFSRGVMEKPAAHENQPSSNESVSPPFIERIIERVTMVKEVLTPAIVSSDSRVNKLITDVADLTSRVDEKGGSGNNGLSLTSLHNMISQSQRIKTLDDVKITNATIEGYVTGATLSNYLPLGGGHTYRRVNRHHLNPLWSLHPYRSKPLRSS